MNQITKEALGEKIKDMRNAARKSQAELGLALGKSHAAVSDIERGKTDLTVKDLTIIADFLGTSTTELISEGSIKNSGSFIQYRDGKDITPEEKKEADKASEDFIKLARELANKKKTVS